MKVSREHPAGRGRRGPNSLKSKSSGIIVDMDSLDYDAEKHILWLVDRIEKESSSPPKSDNKK